MIDVKKKSTMSKGREELQRERPQMSRTEYYLIEN